MHLNDCENRINSNGPFEWIDPERIDGVNETYSRAKNKLKWFQRYEDEDQPALADEVITDYLCECLLERQTLIEENKTLPSMLNINAVMLVKAGVYLICNLGSSYAGTHLSSWRHLLTNYDAKSCINILEHSYESTNSFTRDILRDFILELFRFGPLWDTPEGIFSKTLTCKQNSFLKNVFDNGYITISNKDARLFSDGSKRI